MPGRINPREYDLSELRDAVRERAPSNGGSRADSQNRTDSPPAESRNGRRAALNDHLAATSSCGKATIAEDPDEYLRKRSRTRNWTRNRNQNSESLRTEHPDQPRSAKTVPDRSCDNHKTSHRTDTGSSQHEPKDGDERLSTGSNGDRSSSAQDQPQLGLLARRSGSGDTRPYLDTVPGDYGAQVELFEWLETLVSKAGHDGAVSALTFYESIGWLSAESRRELEAFVRGIRTTESRDEPLGITDHRESLVYIARLAGRSTQ